MRLRTFLESLPLSIVGYDRRRQVAVWNLAAERLFGWAEAEVLGQPDPSVPSEAAGEMKTIVTATFRGETAVQRESVRVTRAGAPLDVELTTTLIPATTREPAVALTILHDVTDRRASEDSIAEREAQLQMILEQMPAIVSTFDANGIVTAARGGGLRALDLDESVFLGRHYTDIIRPDHPFSLSMHAALRGESTSNEQTYGGRSFINRAEALRARDGSIVGAINLGFDVTDLRETETELRESREQIRRLSAAMNKMQEDERRRIAREVHDELGQLLTALRCDLGILRRELRSVPTAALDERIGNMIDLVDLTTKTVRRVATELRPAALDELGLRAAIEHEVAAFAQRTGIDVRTCIRRDELIDSDGATAVYRIIQEGLTNVARHAGATRVELRVEAGEGRVETELRDNGRGITEVEMNSSETLGLLGVRERAYALGGEAVIEPIPGDGTRIFVSFPQ